MPVIAGRRQGRGLFSAAATDHLQLGRSQNRQPVSEGVDDDCGHTPACTFPAADDWSSTDLGWAGDGSHNLAAGVSRGGIGDRPLIGMCGGWSSLPVLMIRIRSYLSACCWCAGVAAGRRELVLGPVSSRVFGWLLEKRDLVTITTWVRPAIVISLPLALAAASAGIAAAASEPVPVSAAVIEQPVPVPVLPPVPEPFVEGRPTSDAAAFGMVEGALLGGGFGGAAGAAVGAVPFMVTSVGGGLIGGAMGCAVAPGPGCVVGGAIGLGVGVAAGGALFLLPAAAAGVALGAAAGGVAGGYAGAYVDSVVPK